jgi:hypothetical protein
MAVRHALLIRVRVQRDASENCPSSIGVNLDFLTVLYFTGRVTVTQREFEFLDG